MAVHIAFALLVLVTEVKTSAVMCGAASYLLLVSTVTRQRRTFFSVRRMAQKLADMYADYLYAVADATEPVVVDLPEQAAPCVDGVNARDDVDDGGAEPQQQDARDGTVLPGMVQSGGEVGGNGPAERVDDGSTAAQARPANSLQGGDSVVGTAGGGNTAGAATTAHASDGVSVTGAATPSAAPASDGATVATGQAKGKRGKAGSFLSELSGQNSPTINRLRAQQKASNANLARSVGADEGLPAGADDLIAAAGKSRRQRFLSELKGEDSPTVPRRAAAAAAAPATAGPDGSQGVAAAGSSSGASSAPAAGPAKPAAASAAAVAVAVRKASTTGTSSASSSLAPSVVNGAASVRSSTIVLPTSGVDVALASNDAGGGGAMHVEDLLVGEDTMKMARRDSVVSTGTFKSYTSNASAHDVNELVAAATESAIGGGGVGGGMPAGARTLMTAGARSRGGYSNHSEGDDVTLLAAAAVKSRAAGTHAVAAALAVAGARSRSGAVTNRRQSTTSRAVADEAGDCVAEPTLRGRPAAADAASTADNSGAGGGVDAALHVNMQTLKDVEEPAGEHVMVKGAVYMDPVATDGLDATLTEDASCGARWRVYWWCLMHDSDSFFHTMSLSVLGYYSAFVFLFYVCLLSFTSSWFTSNGAYQVASAQAQAYAGALGAAQALALNITDGSLPPALQVDAMTFYPALGLGDAPQPWSYRAVWYFWVLDVGPPVMLSTSMIAVLNVAFGWKLVRLVFFFVYLPFLFVMLAYRVAMNGLHEEGTYATFITVSLVALSSAMMIWLLHFKKVANAHRMILPLVTGLAFFFLYAKYLLPTVFGSDSFWVRTVIRVFVHPLLEAFVEFMLISQCSRVSALNQTG